MGHAGLEPPAETRNWRRAAMEKLNQKVTSLSTHDPKMLFRNANLLSSTNKVREQSDI